MDYKSLCKITTENPEEIGVGVDDGGVAVSLTDKDDGHWIFINWKCAKMLHSLLDVCDVTRRKD